jgi:hypothetical protein
MKRKQPKPTKKAKGKTAAEKAGQATRESTPVNGNTSEESAPAMEVTNQQQDAVAPQSHEPAQALVVAGTVAVLADEPGSGKRNVEPLSAQEQEAFRRCEVGIEESKNSSRFEAANVHEIWEKRLYRVEYSSFEQYLSKRWHYSRPYGYMLLLIHRIHEKVSTIVDIECPITSGTQALELAKVPEEKFVEVLKEAKKRAGDGKMTSRHIRQAALALNAGPLVQKKESKNKKIHAPATEPAKSITANIMTPAEVFPHANILSLAELSRMAETLQDIFLDPDRHTEAEALLLKLKENLRLYAEWAAQNLGEGARKPPA